MSRLFSILVILFIPILTDAYFVKFGPLKVEGATVVINPTYIFDKKDSPYIKKHASSQVSVRIKAIKEKDSGFFGDVEVAVLSQEAYDTLGYDDSKSNRVICCDEVDVIEKRCTKNGHVILSKSAFLETTTFSLQNEITEMNYVFDIPYTGVFYLLTGVCDKQADGITLEGEYVIENPYGHLPAPQYGLLPYSRGLFYIYLLVTIVWAVLCFQYMKDIVSVQWLILIVCGLNLVSSLFYYVNIFIYNQFGSYLAALSYLTIILRTLASIAFQILVILITKGLGVTRTAYAESLPLLIVYGLFALIIELWEGIHDYQASLSSSVPSLPLIISTALIKGVWLYVVYTTLMQTMNELQNQKQAKKLGIYRKILILFITAFAVLLVTLLILYNWIQQDALYTKWQIQWFMSDGIWGYYQLFFFLTIAYLWHPSDNIADYAYRLQIATDENDMGGIRTDNSLAINENEPVISVSTIGSKFKPMETQ